MDHLEHAQLRENERKNEVTPYYIVFLAEGCNTLSQRRLVFGSRHLQIPHGGLALQGTHSVCRGAEIGKLASVEAYLSEI
jgi:hypothetical protein